MKKDRPIRDIPISEAKRIAEEFGYDQVVIVGRRVGSEVEVHGEHVTTYGTTREHCRVAALTGDTIKKRILGWPEDKP